MDSPFTGPQQLVGQGDRQTCRPSSPTGTRTVASTAQGRRRRARQRVQPVTGGAERPEVRGRLEVRRRSSARGTRPPQSPPGRSRARPPCRSSRCRRRRRSSSRRSRTCTSRARGAALRLQRGRVPPEAEDQPRLADGRQRRLRPRRPGAGAEARGQVRAPGRRHDDLLPGHDRLHGRADEGQELERPGALALDRDARRSRRSSSSSASSSCRSSSC